MGKSKGGSKGKKAGSKGKAKKSPPSTKGSSPSQEQSSPSQRTSSNVETSAGDTTVTSGDGKTDGTRPPPLNRPMLPLLVLPADVEMPSLERRPSPIVTRDCSNIWFFPAGLIAVAVIVVGMVFLARSMQHIDSLSTNENATDNGTSPVTETEMETSSDWFSTTGAEETGSQPTHEWSTLTESPDASAIARNLHDNPPFTTGPQRASMSLATSDRPDTEETTATTGSRSTQESPPRTETSAGAASGDGPLNEGVIVTKPSTANETAVNATSAY